MKKLLSAMAALCLTAGVAQACPSWANNGQTDVMSGPSLRGGGNSYRVVAGGSEQLIGCGIPFGSDSGQGYVTRDPDFTFQIDNLGSSKLILSTYSECDSVLVINTGGANWYYDDDDNTDSYLDSRIILTRPGSGVFDIWIGTHDGSYCDAVLNVQTVPR